MGNATCQGTLCFRKSEFACACTNKTYCHICFSKHMQETSTPTHSAVHLHPQPDLKHQLILHRLTYSKPDGTTDVYDGYFGEKGVCIKMQYFKDFKCLNRKQEEATLQRSIRHTNICRCIKSWVDETYENGYKFVIILEYGLRDLEEEIRGRAVSNDPWDEAELWRHFSSIIDALTVMQENNLTHRDIKPANILVFPENVLKLADFGLSIQEDDLLGAQILDVVGTVLYLSPILKQAYIDIFEGKNLTATVHHNPYKSDVYSLGLTFLYMASLSPPVGLNSNIGGNVGLRRRIKNAIRSLRFSSKIKELLEAMLEVEEEGRMDFLELRSWMENLEFSDSEDPIPTESSAADIHSTSITEISICESKTSDRLTTEDNSVLKMSLSEELYTYMNQETEATLECPPLSPQDQLRFYASQHILPDELASLYERITSDEEIKFYKYSELLLPIEAQHLGVFLGHLPKLNTLELSSCNLGDQGIRMLNLGLSKLPDLETLSLGENKIGPEGAALLAKSFPKLEKLKILRLWDNNFGDEGASALVKNFLLLDHLEELFLGDNSIGYEGMESIASSLPKSLTVLSLSGNPIGDLGMRFLCESLLKLTKLRQLYLENTKIGDVGVQYLESSIPHSLKTLRLDDNPMQSNSVLKLKSRYPKLKITQSLFSYL
ncbi:unnamed protein product [Blepharisma stoltei]|uniref:Protein kinase domain-containing protein n=1 Tax=Blepharisma stoltei TaxID=1481888 RepID=A0AAU9KBP5_9CILI|nr:unnamed protein product [Blepharisma stoltei]